jgi:probable rRNA maturation factor
MIKLYFKNYTKDKSVKQAIFSKFLKNIQKKLTQKNNKFYIQNSNKTINLFIISDDKIKKINAKFRAQNKETDVISISYLESRQFPKEEVIGEIFISIDTAKEQAKKNHITLDKELSFLFIHGILHIFGYTHKTEKEYKTISDLTEKILKL